MKNGTAISKRGPTPTYTPRRERFYTALFSTLILASTTLLPVLCIGSCTASNPAQTTSAGQTTPAPISTKRHLTYITIPETTPELRPEEVGETRTDRCIVTAVWEDETELISIITGDVYAVLDNAYTVGQGLTVTFDTNFTETFCDDVIIQVTEQVTQA